MKYSTTNVYQMKRETVNFTKSIANEGKRVETKFLNDMVYGIVSSESIVLKKIGDSLHENNKSKNTIDRLSQNLQKEMSHEIKDKYVRKMAGLLDENPVILVDDSDIIKPYGKKFEALGRVRDGSSKDNKIENGYMVTEIVGLTKNKKQPVSLFSHIHSSVEKNYKSTNDVLYQALESVIPALPGKGTFVFDRGYDMNNLYNFMYDKEQDFIVRITENRKLFWKGKWYKSTALRDSRKGKIKTTLSFRENGKTKEITVYISHLKIKITASKKTVNLILVYGIGDTPMMLVSNKEIKSKEDAINILFTYMSRWRVEEYFRFKKQHFGFENFRVRGLTSINNLNTILTFAIGLFGFLAEKMHKSQLPHMLIHHARALRKDVLFFYYQLAQGASAILSYARNGVRDWFKTRSNITQLKIC